MGGFGPWRRWARARSVPHARNARDGPDFVLQVRCRRVCAASFNWDVAADATNGSAVADDRPGNMAAKSLATSHASIGEAQLELEPSTPPNTFPAAGSLRK